MLAKQMDLKWEAFNLLRFAQNFREEVQQSEGSIAFPTVRRTIPGCCWRLSCASLMIV